jgi:toxin-antitoxin system PIN domain toxin
MEALADVNLLLALADPAHEAHGRSSEWYDGLSSGSRLWICRHAQMGLLRVLASETVMQGKPLTLRESWAYYGQLMQDPCIFGALEPRGLQPVWVGLSIEFGASPKVVADSYLAAFAIVGGYTLVSLDQGFRKFAGLNPVLLS